MTDPIRGQFEDYALQIEDLHDQFEAAVLAGNFGLAKTLAATIKEAETIRDRLLCCLGAALATDDRSRPDEADGRPRLLH